jgi:hypothetical protein
MAITPLPTPPSREDPANFATRADAFMAALPDFATETNAVAVEVDNDRIAAAASASTATTQAGLASAQRSLAETAANAASATANVTQWVSGTTYTAGANVWSPINYQTYRRISTGAGTTDPSADAVNWQAITSGLIANDLSGGVQGSLPYQAATGDTAMLEPSTAGYFLTTNGAGANPTWVPPPAGGPNSITTTSPMTANITLTSSSNQVQVVKPTSDAKSIILPDANTIATPSSPRFIVENISTAENAGSNGRAYDVCVRRSDGSLVTVVNAGGTAFISLVDNSTSRGDWVATGEGLAWCKIASNFSSTDTGRMPPFMMSNGNFIVMLGNTMHYVTKTGIVNSYTVTGQMIFGIVEVDSSHLIVCSANTNGSTIYSYYVTFTDTTLTVPSAQSKTLSGAMQQAYGASLVKLSSTNYIIGFAVSGSMAAIGFTLSGATITYGTQNSFVSAADGYPTQQSLVALTSTTAYFSYGVGTANPYELFAVVLTITGTTITSGTPLSLATNTSQFSYNYSFAQNGSIVTIYRVAASTYAIACTVSGTTITKGTAVTALSSTIDTPLRKFDFNASTSLYVCNDYNQKNRGVCLSVTGTTITVRYTPADASINSQTGIQFNTITNSVTGYRAIPTYNSYAGTFDNTAAYLVTLSATTTAESARIHLAGNTLGPLDTTNGQAMNSVCVTTGGVLYTSYYNNPIWQTMNNFGLNARFTGAYGLSYNRITENYSQTNAGGISSSTSLFNGWGIWRGGSNATAILEMAV